MFILRRGQAEFRIPGTLVDQQATCAPLAWDGLIYRTIMLDDPVEAMRVHQNVPLDSGPRLGSGMIGRWFAIDPIMARSEYIARHALPGSFTHQAWVKLPRGATVNVGFCSALFGLSGGAPQVEVLSPPPSSLQFQPIPGWWSDQVGHA